MRLISRLAFLGMVATGSAAMAAPEDVHVLKVRLPDGRVQSVRYKGDIPPRIVIVRRTVDPQEAMIRRMMARMEQQRIAMLRQSTALAAQGSDKPLSPAALPSTSYSYHFMSSGTGKGSCTRIVQMTSYGAGQEPKVVSQTTGDCGTSTAKPIAQPARPALKPRETT